MILENMLSENQTHKATYYTIPFYEMTGFQKSKEMVK